jgi:D-amino-acid oxidase
VESWSVSALKEFRNLVKNKPNSGCVNRTGYMLSKDPIERPWWLDDEMNPKYITVDNDPNDVLGKKRHNHYDHAIEYTCPCIDMPIFLSWLLKRFLNLGGKLKLTEIRQLSGKSFAGFDMIVNCTGLGASKLCPQDKHIAPRRGQLVHMKIPSIQCFYFDCDVEDPVFASYVVPRNDYLVIGGTRKFNTWDTTPNFEDAKKIIDLTSRMVPEIKTSTSDLHLF